MVFKGQYETCGCSSSWRKLQVLPMPEKTHSHLRQGKLEKISENYLKKSQGKLEKVLRKLFKENPRKTRQNHREKTQGKLEENISLWHKSL